MLRRRSKKATVLSEKQLLPATLAPCARLPLPPPYLTPGTPRQWTTVPPSRGKWRHYNCSLDTAVEFPLEGDWPGV